MFTQKQSKPGNIRNTSSESLIQPMAIQRRENGTSEEKNGQQIQNNNISNNSIISPESFKPFKSIQKKSKSSAKAPAQQVKTDTPALQAKNETGMPDTLKSGLENLSGKDLSGVRVHRNSTKPDTIQAHAYTQGQDIYLASGQEKHLPHEGWHVVQQMQGRVQPTIQQKSALINDDSSLEHEADVMGQRAQQMNPENTTGTNKKAESSVNNSVIQRAMKFEYQLKKNFLFRDTGSKVSSLPRKYGPRDYLVQLPNGGRLENETHGQIEYETSWEKKWPKLQKQIGDMTDANDKMRNAATVTGSDGNTYKEFPFANEIEHLSPQKGFSLNDSGTWSRSQKEGEAEVNSTTDTKENFRSTASYATPDNIIQTINNGEEVFIHFFSSDGKWARIDYQGTPGWMWSKSLKTTSKNYESNKDDNGSYSDNPLKKGEKILLKENDSSWKAYIQTSESFEMTQFESYLQEYEPSTGATIISDTRKFLENYNPQKAPVGETPAEKKLREDTFINNNNKLYNLLLMIDLVIINGQNESTQTTTTQPNGSQVTAAGSAKYAFTLMSRTSFGSMFKSMSKPEQELFTKLVMDKKDGILGTMHLTTSSKIFVDGTATGYNPTVNEWLVSITKGNDALSVQSGEALPGAMGRFNIEDEKGKHKGLVRYEARKVMGNSQPDSLWETHALAQFESAMNDRSRPTGKNETGLEK